MNEYNVFQMSENSANFGVGYWACEQTRRNNAAQEHSRVAIYRKQKETRAPAVIHQQRNRGRKRVNKWRLEKQKAVEQKAEN